MRRTLTLLVAGIVTLTLALPANANAATNTTIKDSNSNLFAGYVQKAGPSGYPRYYEILDNITVPTASDFTRAGISRDLANIGTETAGVSGGVEVDTSDNTAFYTAIGIWGQHIVSFAQVKPGDVLQVTVRETGSTNGTPDWLVEIFDDQTGQEFDATNPDAAANTTAGAFEARFQESNGTYIPLTRTSAVTFAAGRVFWAEKGQPKVKVSPLMAGVPKGATLYKLTMQTLKGKTIAAPSKPSDGGSNFSVKAG